MREKYIKQVEKELHIPRKAKKEVIRDLNEIFASALENGETEQQVIDRLGNPKEFAENTAEQLGIDLTSLHKHKVVISGIVALIVSVVAFLIYGTTRAGHIEPGTSGQADAMTNIQIASGLGIDISLLILIIGIVSAILAVIQIVRYVNKKWR